MYFYYFGFKIRQRKNVTLRMLHSPPNVFLRQKSFQHRCQLHPNKKSASQSGSPLDFVFFGLRISKILSENKKSLNCHAAGAAINKNSAYNSHDAACPAHAYTCSCRHLLFFYHQSQFVVFFRQLSNKK